MTINIIKAAVSILLTNLPFGYWRAMSGKYSRNWFLAIHLPVLLVVFFRFYFEIGFAFITYPILVASFFTGQVAGGKLKYIVRKKNKMPENE
ncbi:MAG: hypothetical protein NTW49_07555 [Bacteroidia bacterium]|nr:hypothetical protein [Bacteroidia bacterium]